MFPHALGRLVMSWKNKAVALYRRFGAPVKFAAKLVLGAFVPGGSAVVELVGQLLECVHETAKDNLEIDESRLPAATEADRKRVEEMLGVLGGDLAGLTEQVAALEGLPDAALKILDAALITDDRCRAALHKLDALAQGFDALGKQSAELLRGQGYAAGILEEMLPLMRKTAAVADFVDELCAAGLTAAEFRSALAAFRDGLHAMAKGRAPEAEARLEEVARSRPTSAAAAVAVAAAQTANQDLSGAQQALVRAVRLRPQDAGLAELSRRATQAAQTTPAARPAPSQEPPKVGVVLDGWRLELLLGRGGWGQVFKARRGDEVRALKVMHPDLSRDPAFVERFKAEILTLAGLRGHKHLVEIHGFGMDAGCWYFLMEFIEGVTLEQYLMRKGRLSLAQAVPLFTQVADGLALAHGRGVVHRDVKPANILLRKPHGQPVVVDFGLAALADGSGLTRRGHSAGYTPMFAAPEQLRGKPADARTDVYALAASLFYALNYDKPSLREPDHFEPEHAPEALRDLLTKALHQRPENRPANATEFRSMLEATVAAQIDHTKRSPGDLFTNALGMKFAWMPPGTFLMGSPESEAFRHKHEGPQHEVEITCPFYLGVYPVTKEEYMRAVGLDTGRFPVQGVTWDDAVAFCKALNQYDAKRPVGWEYGLPTEAEWEYACRAGTTTAYFFGDDPKRLGDYAWSQDYSRDGTHEVGTKKPNPWGLYDMVGNVLQWCADRHGKYASGLFKDPSGPDSGKNRVMRGCTVCSHPSHCRSAHRCSIRPDCRDVESSFRVALRPTDPPLAEGRVPSAPAPEAAPGVVACPRCGKEYIRPKGAAGKQYRCSNCEAAIKIPAQE
jgi:formylglycine-generating enzyme required for sulfatase activity